MTADELVPEVEIVRRRDVRVGDVIVVHGLPHRVLGVTLQPCVGPAHTGQRWTARIEGATEEAKRATYRKPWAVARCLCLGDEAEIQRITTPLPPPARGELAVGDSVTVQAFGTHRQGTVTWVSERSVGVRYRKNHRGDITESTFEPAKVHRFDALPAAEPAVDPAGFVVRIDDAGEPIHTEQLLTAAEAVAYADRFILTGTQSVHTMPIELAS